MRIFLYRGTHLHDITHMYLLRYITMFHVKYKTSIPQTTTSPQEHRVVQQKADLEDPANGRVSRCWTEESCAIFFSFDVGDCCICIDQCTYGRTEHIYIYYIFFPPDLPSPSRSTLRTYFISPLASHSPLNLSNSSLNLSSGREPHLNRVVCQSTHNKLAAKPVQNIERRARI